MERAMEVLAAEVARLQSGQDWQRYLALQAALHAYSPNNVLLIAAQHATAFREGRVGSPEPGYVAGFVTWRALGRAVERGQRGYLVLAPCAYERRVAVDGAGEARSLARGEEPGPGEQVEARRSLAGFRVAHVFSVHQTSGAALAEPPRPRLLAGEAPPGLGEAVRQLVEARGFSVGTVPDALAIDGANGLTRWDDRSVVVRADMDDAAMVKTLLHEAAHVFLHEGEPGRSLPREAKEVEAESVAYLVAAAHGMPTGDYSFPYVAAWAGKNGARAVQAVQARVALAARGLIAASPAPCSGGGRPPGPAAVPTGRWGGPAPVPGRGATTVPSTGPAL
jgi:hypothetical protein